MFISIYYCLHVISLQIHLHDVSLWISWWCCGNNPHCLWELSQFLRGSADEYQRGESLSREQKDVNSCCCLLMNSFLIAGLNKALCVADMSKYIQVTSKGKSLKFVIFLRCATRGSSGLLMESALILKDALVITSKLYGPITLKRKRKKKDKTRCFGELLKWLVFCFLLQIFGK